LLLVGEVSSASSQKKKEVNWTNGLPCVFACCLLFYGCPCREAATTKRHPNMKQQQQQQQQQQHATIQRIVLLLCSL